MDWFSPETFLGIVIGIPIGWTLNTFLRGTVVPVLVRHGWR